MLTLVFVIYFTLLFLKLNSIVFSNNVIFVKPLWGIGNRLRTIRRANALAKHLNRQLVVVEHVDDGLKLSMKMLFGIRLLHMSPIIFKLIYERWCVPFKFNDQCSLKHDVSVFDKAVTNNNNIYITACDMNISGVDMNDRSIYETWKPYKDTKTQQIIKQLKKHKRVVGVHIRQGNVNDWERGYFFNDEWKDIKQREPDSAPHFCCYDDKNKNLSACTSNVQNLDGFIKRMKKYPTDTHFFVCSDRVGCIIHLYQLFPNRITSNNVEMEGEQLDIYKSMQDFLSLAACDEIIVSDVSSFSDEAKRINDIRVVRINNKH